MIIYFGSINKRINFAIFSLIEKKPFHIHLIKKKEFSFTHGIENWKESTTIKYKKVSIGEYQIHKNRDCIKFRFNFKNMLNFLKVDTL